MSNTIFLPGLTITEAATSTNGGPPPSEVKVVAGSDGTTIHTILTDATGAIVIANASIPPVGQETMANSLPVVIASDQSPVPVSQSGTWDINDISGTISLPTGAATDAKQDTGNASLASIDTKLTAPLAISDNGGSITVDGSVTVSGTATVSGTVAVSNFPASQAVTQSTSPWVVDGSASTQPISAAALPLPTGAATETTLAAIDTKTPALGQNTMAASVPVTIASNQSSLGVIPTDGTNNIGTLASVATAQYTNATPGRSLPTASLMLGWDGGTHREIAVNNTGIVQTNIRTPSSAVSYPNAKVAAASVTSGLTTILTTTGVTGRMVYISNSLNEDVYMSFTGADQLWIPAGCSVTMDYDSNTLSLPAGTAIQLRYDSVAPTTGSIAVMVVG
jgi:hypothetical protein